MSTRNDGGPAFPRPASMAADGHIDNRIAQDGMSLRDYFAAAAMTALSRDFRNATGISDNIRNLAKLNAELAYCVADAMLKARQQ